MGGWHRQGRHGPVGLPGDAQRLTGGRQDLQVRAGAKQGFGERRAGSDQVLAIVQDQQQLPGPQVVGERLRHRAARLLAHAEGRGYGFGREGGVREGRQTHPPHPVAEPPDEVLGDPQGEARLAASPGSGEGEEAGAREQPLDLGDLTLPTHEAGELQGQVAPHRSCGRGTGRFLVRNVGAPRAGDPERAHLCRASSSQVALSSSCSHRNSNPYVLHLTTLDWLAVTGHSVPAQRPRRRNVGPAPRPLGQVWHRASLLYCRPSRFVPSGGV